MHNKVQTYQISAARFHVVGIGTDVQTLIWAKRPTAKAQARPTRRNYRVNSKSMQKGMAANKEKPTESMAWIG